MKRELGTFHLTINAKDSGATFDEMKSLADAIKKKVKRIAVKNDFDLIIFIGISQNDKNDGKISITNDGVKFFEKKTTRKREVKPHIHIAFYGVGVNTVSRKIAEKLRKAHPKMSISVNRHDDIHGLVKYIFTQSENLRSGAYNNYKSLPMVDEVMFEGFGRDKSLGSRHPVFLNNKSDFAEKIDAK